MTKKELANTTVREFFNRIEGHLEKEEYVDIRNQHLLAAIRLNAYYAFLPHTKKQSTIAPEELWRYSFDKAKKQETQDKQEKERRTQIQSIKQLVAQGRASPAMRDWLEKNGAL